MSDGRTPVRLVTDAERRARLASRHALSPSCRLDAPAAVTGALTALHATEPATVYLSCWARMRSLEVAELDRALYTDRGLVKQLAMRRTLFVFPREVLPAVWPSASARVALAERGRLVKDIEAAGVAADGGAWLDRARAEVLALLDGAPDGLQATEIRQAVPTLDVRVADGVWSASRVLTNLGATGDIVRGVNAGRWAVSRPRWTLMRQWLGEVPPPLDAAAGYRELVHRWLRTFGPGTEDDIVWWLGATKAVVRAALADLGAVPVALERDGTGWLLPDDLAEPTDPGSWVALLPVLDPTVMGWRDREFYLGPHREQLFDRNGNAGTTAWADGRIVGCWTQDDAGAVRVHPVQRLPARTRRALDEEAARLTGWLGGLRIGTVYTSPAMKAEL